MTIAIRSGHVPNDELRREYVRRRDLGWICAKDVAHRCGWMKRDGHADVTRVERVLGLVECRTGGYRYYQRSVRMDLALQLVDAMNADPVDVGL